jgi:hypothetical protein
MPGTALGTDAYRILGGVPERSAILFRMQNRGNFHAMPPLASKVVDTEAANVIADWIRTLPGR